MIILKWILKKWVGCWLDSSDLWRQ
jgi:hypothetical protein